MVLAIAAFGVGFSKTGINGVGVLAVAVFALALPTKESVGVVLPILIAADIVAVASYHRRASWDHLWRLFPWAITGVILGYFAMKRITADQVKPIIGTILIGILLLQWWRERKHLNLGEMEHVLPHNLWFTACMGILGGFTTMLANAAGPIMIIYLLSTRLPKMEHIGTGAWYFLILNTFKVPFSMDLGLINTASFTISVCMMPVAVAGAFVGRGVIKYVNQGLFNRLAYFSTFIAALRIAGVDAWIYSLFKHS